MRIKFINTNPELSDRSAKYKKLIPEAKKLVVKN